MKYKNNNKRIKSTLMLARKVKTNQQIWREVELKGCAFSYPARWQSEYYQNK